MTTVCRMRTAALRLGARLTIAAMASVAIDAALPQGTQPAMIPVEVLPIDPAIATGMLWLRGPRWSEPAIALQPVRAARGIAVDGAGDDPRVYVLALLGSVPQRSDGALELDVAPDRRAWCEIPRFGGPLADCFQDLDADGMLETTREGVLGAGQPLSLNSVRDAAAMSSPVAYRAARPEELPVFQVGYVSCLPKPAPTGPGELQLRYATEVRNESTFAPGQAASVCNGIGEIVETRDNGDTVVRFGRFTALLHPEGEEITTTLLEGIAPGTYLGEVRADRPLIDATDVTARERANVPRRPFLYFVERPTLASSEVGVGEPFVDGEVAHGITGTLAVEAKTGGWFKVPPIPAGTPLYGAPMSFTGQSPSVDASLVWCAPQQDGDRWISQCFAGAVLARNFRPYVVQYLSLESSPGVPAPIVERGPVDFGAPLFLTIRFDGIDRRSVRLSWSVGPKSAPDWIEMRLRRGADGAGLLGVGGAVFAVRPSPDRTRATIETLEDFVDGADALPFEAVAVQR